MTQLPRIYPNLLSAVIDALQSIFSKKELADVVVERTLRSDARWGARDRRWIAEEIYYAVRHYRALYELLGDEPSTIQQWYQLVGVGTWLRFGEIPKHIPQWQKLNAESLAKNWVELKENRAIMHSLPDWLDAEGQAQMGEELWNKIVPSMNMPAPLILRVNKLKKTLREVQEGLEKHNIATTPVENCQNALEVDGRPKLVSLEPFKRGWFEIQDTASQQVSLILQPQANELVIDTCAGAGGKSLHMAALMQNKGKIYAMDVEEHKLQETEKRAERAGVKIIETRLIKSPFSYAELMGKADKVLIDAPCSGMGTLRRSADLKWKLTKERLAEITALQTKIFQDYAPLAKVGGTVAYATCSIMPSENQDQVAKFLASEVGQKFELLQDKTFYPHSDNTDGFYVAILKRLK